MLGDADSGVRHLVLVHGRDRARTMVEPEQRRIVDIAAEVLADEDGKIGISYSGFCLTGLPHKRLPDGEAWDKRGHRVRLIVEPGRLVQGRGPAKMLGVPYGARARMILLYLQTQAVRTGSREVELGRSMHNWLGRMGLSWGGETGRALREQAARIAACSLKFFWEGEDASGWEKGGFVRSGLRFHTRTQSHDDRQCDLWEDRVVLDESFYDALRRHPVPLREAALRELADRSVSLDLYIWLAYRLHTLEKPTPVRWAALAEQFGTSYSRTRDFNREFRKALAPAVAAYPEARVGIEEQGLVLYPSRPPVAPRLVGIRG
jgi:Plasmid encoded RepA protein